MMVSGFWCQGKEMLDTCMKLHLTNAEVGMWKDGVAALCLFNLKSIECLPSKDGNASLNLF